MRKFTKTMLVLCAVFVSLGLILCIAALSTGTRFLDLRNAAESRNWSLLSWDSEEHRLVAGGRKEESGSTKHYEETFNDIRSIDLELEISDVDITYYEGDDISLTADMKNGRQLKYKENGKTLKIWDEGNKRSIPASDNISKLTLKVPKDLVFREMELSMDMGEANIRGIAADSADISCDMGKVKMEGSILEEGSFECNMGSIEVTLEGKKDDFDYELDCGMGSVSIDGDSYTGLSVSKKIDNRASKDLELECDMGSINIDFKGGN